MNQTPTGAPPRIDGADAQIPPATDAARAQAAPAEPIRTFRIFDAHTLLDFTGGPFPYYVQTFCANKRMMPWGHEFGVNPVFLPNRPSDYMQNSEATVYGMVVDGEGTIQCDHVRADGTRQNCGAHLSAGMFFVMPTPFELWPAHPRKDFKALLIHRTGYVGLPQVGGPVEGAGRLRYIDGCSDTLLVCPPQVGEPCLNLLHIPSGINQTAHTHPSDRVGVILRGKGYCLTPAGDELPDDDPQCLKRMKSLVGAEGGVEKFRRMELLPGMAWHIPAGTWHSFHTEGESMDVIAFHPDSTFGPSHDAHPMLSRSYVNGVSASDMPEIRTQKIAQ